MKQRVLKFKNTNSKIGIICSMLFPFFLAIVSFIVMSSYKFYRNKEIVLDRCISTMQLFSQRCENEIMNVVQSAVFLSDNEDVYNALNGTADLYDTKTVFNIKNQIFNFEESQSVVRDVVIVNRENKKVITSNGIYSIDEYFDNIVTYSRYNKEYWKSYRPFVSTRYIILLPSEINAEDNVGAVFPILIFENHNNRFKNLLVVDISIDTLITMQNNYLYNKDTKIFLMNNHSGDIFYHLDNKSVTKNILNDELYENLLNKAFFKQDVFEFGKCYVATYSTQNNLNGYTYFGVIPCKSIYKIDLTDVEISILIALLLVIISVFYSINSANKILLPIQKTIETISPTNTASEKISSENVFESLEAAVANIRKMNGELYETLPYAQEKYLINFLNSAEYAVTEETKMIIKNSLPFKYEYFALVMLQIYPTKQFYEMYDQGAYLTIKSEIISIIKQIFCDKYLSFYLTGDKDTSYIILNTETEEGIEDIRKIISEIGDILKYDNDLLNVYAGVGGVYKGWEGLKTAHSDALSDLKYIHKNLRKSTENKMEFLNDADISELYKTLMAYDMVSAKKLIDRFCENANNDQIWLKQIYTQILTTIFKVMRTRNIPYNDNQLDFELYSNILSKSCSEIYKDIVVMMNTIRDFQNVELSANLGEEIIEYLNNNFSDENLSLDFLAEKFGVQPTYVSTVIKNTIGTGFHKYITSIRVSKSKQLLTQTDMNIQEIYESCGFYSKSTFFRVFKADTGVTPNDYRKMQNK